MAKRRKRGIFDPDYRTQGWNQSAFAPKNNPMNMTQLSLAVVVFLFIGLYMVPATKPAMMTMSGLAVALIGAFILWITLALLLRRWAWRRVQKKITPAPPQESAYRQKADAILSPQGAIGRKPTIDSKSNPSPSPVTPDDRIQQQLADRRKRLENRVETHGMRPDEFEYEVARIIRLTTGKDAVVIGGAGDGGVDVEVYDGDRLVGVVQCKRYQPDKTLPPGYIRELSTVKQQQKVAFAYLVTTAKFSRAARLEAASLGIHLIDGKKFEKMRRQLIQ